MSRSYASPSVKSLSGALIGQTSKFPQGGPGPTPVPWRVMLSLSPHALEELNGVLTSPLGRPTRQRRPLGRFRTFQGRPKDAPASPGHTGRPCHPAVGSSASEKEQSQALSVQSRGGTA